MENSLEPSRRPEHSQDGRSGDASAEHALQRVRACAPTDMRRDDVPSPTVRREQKARNPYLTLRCKSEEVHARAGTGFFRTDDKGSYGSSPGPWLSLKNTTSSRRSAHSETGNNNHFNSKQGEHYFFPPKGRKEGETFFQNVNGMKCKGDTTQQPRTVPKILGVYVCKSVCLCVCV